MMELTVENLQRLTLKPDEILVVTTNSRLMEVERERIKHLFQAVFAKNGYGNDVIVINEEIEMFAISKEE